MDLISSQNLCKIHIQLDVIVGCRTEDQLVASLDCGLLQCWESRTVTSRLLYQRLVLKIIFVMWEPYSGKSVGGGFLTDLEMT